MFLLESMVIAGCYWGNADGCQTAGQAYLKQTKMDRQIDVINENLKKKYKPVYYLGMAGASLVQKRYTGNIYHNLDGAVDFKDTDNKIFTLIYKFTF